MYYIAHNILCKWIEAHESKIYSSIFCGLFLQRSESQVEGQTLIAEDLEALIADSEKVHLCIAYHRKHWFFSPLHNLKPQFLQAIQPQIKATADAWALTALLQQLTLSVHVQRGLQYGGPLLIQTVWDRAMFRYVKSEA